GAFIFSHLISDPIKRISFFLQNVDFNSFNRKIDIKPQWYKKINNYYLYDEIDLLIDKFSEMYNRLKVNYNELQKTQNSLIHSEKLASIGTLSAGIAHEINNPLAGIQNCIKRMSKKPDDMEQQKQYLDLMTEAVDRISFVVNGLLDFSRKRDFKIEKIDISKVIDKALTLVQYNLDKSGISIVKEYPSDIPRVTGSENHLEQVLLNLLLNSIEAINALKLINKNIKGFIKIVLIDKNDHLWLWIEDNGIGIEEEKIKYIFDPFFTNKKEGTGLGLAISYKIINDHDGSIKAIKNNFGGLTFLIELPKSKID
ncbi:MAG: GHKL domain-containing protein, partial [Bacteroidetes bacterium]|nr:GHKL domain-containing protein [Bacteroidota bacterium]